MTSMKNLALSSTILAGALALASPAHAILQIAAQIGVSPVFTCFDNQAGCDTNLALGILDTGTITLGGVSFSGSVQTQTIGPNVLNTSSSQITNQTGGAVAFTLAVGGTNFVGPVTNFAASSAETFQVQAPAGGTGTTNGSTITLGFFGDTANQQGADLPNDTPGVSLASFVDTATGLSPQSFSHNTTGPFVDPNLHSLTLFATGSLNNNNTLVGRLQAIETSNVVPEPASLAILGSALLGLGFVGRRRRKNTAV